jgi:APA family basic amino acid/polyamine antiporter
MGLALSLVRPMGPGSKAIVREWADAVLHTPQIFRRLAFRKRTLEEELQQALLRGSMRKAFGGFDLWMVGLGLVVATGWATLSGSAAQYYAGPAIVISYLFSGLAALTSACCFAELCAE